MKTHEKVQRLRGVVMTQRSLLDSCSAPIASKILFLLVLVLSVCAPAATKQSVSCSSGADPASFELPSSYSSRPLILLKTLFCSP